MTRGRVNYFLIFVGLFSFSIVFGQDKKSDLFSGEAPLDVRLGYSFKEVEKSTIDTVYFPATLFFKKGDVWDSIALRVRARGNFRRKYCGFAPIRIKIKKKDADKTLFDNDRDLKLVLPCQAGDSYNQMIYREYLCYKISEILMPHHFHTRLLNLELTDQAGKKPKSYSLKAFFIEDNDRVAKRGKGEISDIPKIHPARFNDTLMAKHDFFQHLISNTDWSSSVGHNVSVMKASNKYVPLAYDFDMSGIVNAPYATVNEALSITSVRQRLYRGYCVNEAVFQFVRQEYLDKEQEVMNVIDSYAKYFDAKELDGIKKFVGSYFLILKNDSGFKTNVLDVCRKY